MRRRTLVLALLALAALAALAVGAFAFAAQEPRLTKKEYAARVTAEFAAPSKAFREASKPAASPVYAKRLRRAGLLLSRAGKHLGGLQPPTKVEQANRHLATALGRFGRDLQMAAASVLAGDQLTYYRVMIKHDGQTKMLAALRELSKAGYPVRVPAAPKG